MIQTVNKIITIMRLKYSNYIKTYLESEAKILSYINYKSGNHKKSQNMLTKYNIIK